MRRRTLLAATLFAPAIARAQTPRTLTYVPYVDLAILDPILNTASQTRTHGYVVYDTLYGIDEAWRVQPQMLEGHTAENNFQLWTLTLREGLTFHDATPVLARDVVASIRRWAARDEFGETLMEETADLTAPDDRRILFRMKRPFPLLPDALGKIAPTMPAIMPARLAETDPRKAVPEIIGSGPYRFLPKERIPGARVVYERFSGYRPRPEPASLTAGGKIAHIDRLVWQTMPDSSTVAAAIQSGEIDWWDTVPPDLVPLLRKSRDLTVKTIDTTGVMPILRFNCLHPPFDNKAIRRAILEAVDQSAFMAAFSSEPALWHAPVGMFTPGTPMASTEGLAARTRPTPIAEARAAIVKAGYKGEKILVMNPTDHPVNTVMAQLAADLLAKLGMNVDLAAMDAGTMFQRRANRGPVEKGGWSLFPSMINGMDVFDPAVAFLARGNGGKAWFGWPDSPRLETLREAWLTAPTLPDRQRLCAEMQSVLWEDAPYIPLGQIILPTAYRNTIAGMPTGFPKFWGVTKS